MSLRLPPTATGLCPPPTDPESPGWAESWDHLGRAYRPALLRYAYSLLSGAGSRADVLAESEDLIQDFFVDAMRSGRLAARGREILSFRGWILQQVHCFAVDRHRRQHAQKRRPAKGFANPEVLANLADDARPPGADLEFDKGALQVALERAMVRVAEETRDAATGALWVAILDDLLATDGESRSDLALRFGITPTQLARHRFAARARLAALLREELRSLVSDPEELEEMLRNLGPFLPPT